MKNKKIFALIMALPLLVGCRSSIVLPPNENIVPSGIEEGKFNVISSTKIEGEEEFYHIIGTLENTSDFYIAPYVGIGGIPGMMGLPRLDFPPTVVEGKIEDEILNYELLGPGETSNIVADCEFDAKSEPDYEFETVYVKAYDQVCEGLTVSFNEKISLVNNDSSSWTYSINVSGNLPKSEYDYGFIADIEIDSKIHHVLLDTKNQISSNEELNVDSVLVKKITIIQSKEISKGAQRARDTKIIFSIIGAVIFPFALIGVFVVAPAIVIPKAIRKARRKAKENN